MATKYETVEVWVLIDEVGNAVSSTDPDALNDLYEEKIQPIADAMGLRRVMAKVKAPLPTVIEVEAEMVEEEEAGAVAVAG